MRVRSFATAAALCTLAIACKSGELTQLVVVVDSDSDDFGRVVISFDRLSYMEPVEIDVREQGFPRRVTLVHDGGPLGPFDVTVSAFEPDADDPILVEPRKELFFERGRALTLKVDLLQDCIGHCTDPQALACFDGPDCEASNSARARQLTDWDGMVDPLGVDNDAGAGTAGASGAGSGAGSGGSGTSGAGGTDPLDPVMPIPIFPYEPSNFEPEDPLVPEDRPAVVLDCDGEMTFDSTSLTFPEWCGDEPIAKMIVQRAGGEAALLVMDTLSIAEGTTLRLVGTRPVILAVYGDAHVLGAIDASAVSDTPGAGGDIDCGTAAGSAGMDAEEITSSGSGSTGIGVDGATGGGGGGFGTAGGRGGASQDAPSTAGGTTLGDAALSPLRGGCPGGSGGLGEDASAAPGGAGGGAVQISAAGRLDVVGSIAANGGGGGANESLRAGGGGGGSGGAILLEGQAVMVDASALVVANGGGGGGGNPTALDARATAGTDGGRSIAAATGGTGANSGGRGGFGASRVAAAEDGEDAEQSMIGPDYGAGGGGGGGAGRIHVISQTSTCASSGKFSPALANECGACADCLELPSPECQLIDSGSQSYMYCEEVLSWSDAQASCASVGMSLAQVDDAAEQGFLVGLVADDTWLGARDSVDGEWSWEPSGTTFWSEQLDEAVDGLYADWASGQPDVDLGDQDCLAESQFGWVDLACEDEIPYLCEL